MTGGDAEEFLRAWCGAIAAGCEAGFRVIRQLTDWADRARRTTARIKGSNAGLVIDALVAHPVLSAASLEDEAAISRDTAERLLARLQGLGLVREITGGRRYRFWRSAV